MIDREMIRSALAALVERLTLYVPSLAVACLLIVAGWAVGRLMRSLVARLLVRLRINEAAERSGLSAQLKNAKFKASPVELLSQFSFWLVFLFFVVLAVQRLGIDVTAIPVSDLLSYLPRVAGAVLLLVFGALVAQLVGRTVEAGAAGMQLAGHRALGRFVRGLLLVIVVLVAVGQLGFDVSVIVGTVTQLVLIAAGGAALAFALGGGEIARNVLAGYYIKDFLATGDDIEVGGVSGTLERIGVVNCTVSQDGQDVFIANTKFLAEDVKTRTSGDSAT